MVKLADMNLFDLCMRSEVVLPKIPKAAMARAKRFVFDSPASQFIGELLTRAPLEVLSQHHFAKPPYPTTWIEMDHDAYYRLGLKRPPQTWGGNPDARFGILISNDERVMLFVSGVDGSVSSCPFTYDLHRPVSFDDELGTAQELQTSRLMLRMWHLGGVLGTDDAWWQSTEASDICRSHRMTVLPEVLKLPTEKLNLLLRSHTGNLKLILSMLLLLVRPHSAFLINEVGHRRAIVKGRQQVLQEHHVIKLRVEHKDPVTRYLSHLTTGAHRRLHDVHGHWAQHRNRGPCDHAWHELDVDRYECVKCGAKRWWRKDHQRGKKHLGVVTKEYEVTR